jgi:hypothetical protein
MVILRGIEKNSPGENNDTKNTSSFNNYGHPVIFYASERPGFVQSTIESSAG